MGREREVTRERETQGMFPKCSSSPNLQNPMNFIMRHWLIGLNFELFCLLGRCQPSHLISRLLGKKPSNRNLSSKGTHKQGTVHENGHTALWLRHSWAERLFLRGSVAVSACLEPFRIQFCDIIQKTHRLSPNIEQSVLCASNQIWHDILRNLKATTITSGWFCSFLCIPWSLKAVPHLILIRPLNISQYAFWHSLSWCHVLATAWL